MDLEKKLEKALEEAKLKKDEAKAEDETITDQLKRGIAYRKDQLLASTFLSDFLVIQLDFFSGLTGPV